ncbi:MAG: DUF488 family protein [Solirubrobacterales bacterium]|nr:DUF488 family protein [Solirubrobacterales bacterium]
MDAPREILTVGHSTHSIDDFLALLGGADVEAIADVRRYPGSRRNPQFGAAALAASLREGEIGYEPFGDELGRRRRSAGAESSRNAAWRNESFRAYADHMADEEFAAAVARLERLAGERRTAVMCAEADWRRCHRQLIADAFRARGWRVVHLLSGGRREEHRLSPHAVVDDHRVTYPGQPALDV